MTKFENRKYVCLSTKISESAWARLQEIAKRGGYKSCYELFQYIVQRFLDYADPGAEEKESSEEEKEFSLWAEMLGDWMNHESKVITIKPKRKEEMQLARSVNVFRVSGKQKRYITRYLRIDANGDKKIVGNVDAIFSDLLRLVRPNIYRELMKCEPIYGTSSTIEIVKGLLEDTEQRRKELLTDSGDYAMNEYGNKPIRHFARKPHEL